MTKNVLFVIAHPDDECMFFTPTIKHYRYELGYNISVACLSNGNADGLGKIREKELVDSCIEMGIEKGDVYIDKSNKFQDGMKIYWDIQQVEAEINLYAQKIDADIIISFDEYGISNHPNHISIANALQSFIVKRNKSNGNGKQQVKKITAYKLETVNLLRKYIGIADIALTKSVLSSTYNSNSTKIITTLNLFPPSSYPPMTKHKSQFVWFRYLFVFFSRYSFINTLIEIN